MFRVGIWAAVSTEPQAEDNKVEDQAERCRAVVRRRGWTEVRAYVVPGKSRERYINLRDAEDAIPELHALLDAAQRREINLVVTVDFNRFRGLTDAVAKTLAAYGCQLYAVAQPVEPQEPDAFDAYASDSITMMVGLAQIMSNTQISDLRRKYQSGMPARISKYGLHWNGAPYAYQKPAQERFNRKAVLIPKPSEVEIVIQLKGEYLAGRSGTELARRLNESGVPSPRGGKGGWTHNGVLEILTNPFYAGLVVCGKSSVVRDPRTGTRKRRRVRDPRHWKTNQGKHVPLWSLDEHARILQARDDRARSNRGVTRVTHTWSRLLRCAACGAKLYVHNPENRNGGSTRRYYECPNAACPGPPGRISDSQMAARFPALLEDALAAERRAIDDAKRRARPDRADQAAQRAGQLHKQLAGLDARRARHHRAYGDGHMTYEEYQGLLAEVAAERERLSDSLAAAEAAATALDRRERQLGRVVAALPGLADRLVSPDSAAVNHELGEIVERVHVAAGRVTRVELRRPGGRAE